jgi:hypothetical protein
MLAIGPRLAPINRPCVVIDPHAIERDVLAVAAVVNYVRTHFSNNYRDAVTPADVKAARRP